MKLVPIALLGAAAALVVNLYIIYTEMESPASVTAATPPAATAATAFQRAPTEQASARPTPVDGTGATEETTKALAALRQEVAYIRAAVSALQQQASMAESTAVVTSLQAEIAALWRYVRAHKGVSALATAGEQDPGKQPRADPLARAEAERQRQAQLQAVETAFRQEPLDPQWSSQATLTVQQALAGSATEPVTVQAIECRSQTCRVEVTVNDTAALAQLIPALAEQVAAILPSITANQMQDDTSATTLILYLSRNLDASS